MGFVPRRVFRCVKDDENLTTGTNVLPSPITGDVRRRWDLWVMNGGFEEDAAEGCELAVGGGEKGRELWGVSMDQTVDSQ
jgi:hypothetical protein